MKITRLELKKKKNKAEEAAVPIKISDELSSEVSDTTEELETPLNAIYSRISMAFHVAEYIFLIATLIFAVVFLANNPEALTYRNLLAVVNER